MPVCLCAPRSCMPPIYSMASARSRPSAAAAVACWGRKRKTETCPLLSLLAQGPSLAHDSLMPRPAVVVPDTLCATEAEIFRPVDPALVPEIADVLAHMAKHDPDVLAAVADVDRSLLWPGAILR